MRFFPALAAFTAALIHTAPSAAADTDSVRHSARSQAQSPALSGDTGSARDKAADPFLAGAMGIIPFVSGFYISQSPAKGVVFSLVDGLMVLGMYTARYTDQGDPDNVRYYFLLMGVNNVLDAVYSARDAAKRHAPRSQVTLRPEGGVQYALQWKF